MWFVTQVLTGREEEIREWCVVMDVCRQADVFYFRSVQKKKVKGEEMCVLRPLFPGYLFFEAEDAEGAAELKRRLRRVPAMTRLLVTGDEITAVYPEEEALLRNLGGEDHVIDVSYGIREGERVTVTKGPLKGQEYRIKKIDRHRRKAILEVRLFHRLVDMPVGLEILRSVPDNCNSDTK